MWYIYTMEYYSAIKRNKIVPFAEGLMDLETFTESEISQREKKQIYYHLYVESRKMVQMNLFAKQKERHRHSMDTKGGKEHGING